MSLVIGLHPIFKTAKHRPVFDYLTWQNLQTASFCQNGDTADRTATFKNCRFCSLGVTHFAVPKDTLLAPRVMLHPCRALPKKLFLKQFVKKSKVKTGDTVGVGRRSPQHSVWLIPASQSQTAFEMWLLRCRFRGLQEAVRKKVKHCGMSGHCAALSFAKLRCTRDNRARRTIYPACCGCAPLLLGVGDRTRGNKKGVATRQNSHNILRGSQDHVLSSEFEHTVRCFLRRENSTRELPRGTLTSWYE